MNNEFNNGITNEDMEGIDDIVDASNINNEVTEKSNTEESIHIEDSGRLRMIMYSLRRGKLLRMR